MSSVVSLRSYERRQKSAGARLERTLTPIIPSISVSPPTNTSGAAQIEPPAAVTVPPRRAMSARERKREHEASDIFPEVETSKVDPEWGITKYSEDFGPKAAVTPVSIRPLSPTRKNNPHPAQAFMKWQYPVRIHKHQKAVPPPPDAWRYINERFYEDYTDTYNTGDAKNEVPVTNLAKIEFPGTKKRHSINGHASTPHLFSGVTGTKAKLNPRHLQKDKDTEQSLKSLRPPSPQSRMMQNTLKGSALPVFKEWLKTASLSERDVVLQMLQAANNDSNETRMNKALNRVLQGDSAEKVQEWLKNTSESERHVLLRVLETLALATADNEVSMHTQPIGLQLMYPNYFGGSMGHHRHHRHGYTYPISLQGHRHSSRSTHHHGNHHSRHHHHHHRSSKKKSEQKDEGYSSSVLSDTHSGFGLVGKKLTTRKRKEEKTTKEDQKPVLWQHRILKKHTGATSFHAAGVFNQPQKDRGQHFSMHPEWPTA